MATDKPLAAVKQYIDAFNAGDVLREGRQHGARGYFVSIGEPLQDGITDGSAYVVAPATRSFEVDDNRVTQTGAFFTAALRKEPDGWRIAAWACTKGTQ